MNLFRPFRRVYFRVPSEEKALMNEETEEDLPRSSNELRLVDAHIKLRDFNQFWKITCRVVEVIFVVICAWMFLVGLTWQLNIDNQCFNIHNFYTPATEKNIDTGYQLWQFNGTVGWPSPYAPRTFHEGPTPEIDAAWDRFQARPMSVPLEVVEKSGENEEAVRLSPELGGGYLAWAEVNHQLHCLNLMRKAIYSDYYYNITRELQREPFELYAHLDHCVEMLRQVLMCNADTGLQLHHWVKDNPTPIPNSNTWHKCKNFESILDWTHRMQIPDWEGYLPILPGSRIYDQQP